VTQIDFPLRALEVDFCSIAARRARRNVHVDAQVIVDVVVIGFSIIPEAVRSKTTS
jgi:hypothetical protein